MKILKSNTKEVFDTENVNFKGVYDGMTSDNLRPMHHSHELTDYEFLKQYFPLDHSIFIDFSKSFYYILPKI
jgi:hypothetical protein